MGHIKKGNKEDRKASAKIRAEDYKKLTTQQKLDLLDKKLGKGVGATKQRKKLLKNLINIPQETPKKEKETVIKPQSPKDKFNKKYGKKKNETK